MYTKHTYHNRANNVSSVSAQTSFPSPIFSKLRTLTVCCLENISWNQTQIALKHMRNVTITPTHWTNIIPTANRINVYWDLVYTSSQFQGICSQATDCISMAIGKPPCCCFNFCSCRISLEFVRISKLMQCIPRMCITPTPYGLGLCGCFMGMGWWEGDLYYIWY